MGFSAGFFSETHYLIGLVNLCCLFKTDCDFRFNFIRFHQPNTSPAYIQNDKTNLGQTALELQAGKFNSGAVA